jgi:hypothetical protein
MAKRHVENANVHEIAPTAWSPPGLPAGAVMQVLSDDPASGALTGIVTLPAGFATSGPVAAGMDLQLFVLEGTLVMGTNVLGPGTYCFHPAGSPQGAWSVQSATRALVIVGDQPAFESTRATKSDADAIVALDTWQMQWVDPLVASDPSTTYRTGVMVKLLREDRRTGSTTHLAGLMPGWYMPGLEVHPVCEENYCLSGDVHIGRVGSAPGYTMTEGVFLCRPAGIAHGPILSKNGNVNFCYAHGRLGIDYQDAPDSATLIQQHLTTFPWR